ncbi:alpha/beta hydrolase [Sphingomonas swuensis]|uniref:Alpha/beta hydrolase n=1 Tax=Sphingomonas swuensis TaxID=977800 RepID=A0ABP7ST01_9SPHN
MPPLLIRAALLSTLLVAAPACGSPVTDRIYPAPQEALTLAGLPSGSKFLPVTTRDGVKLTGILAPGRADRPLLLVFHGNASSATTALRWLGPLTEDGYRILSAEYRGYSGNAGKPSEAGLVQDAAAFLAAARIEAGGQPVWVVGHSLGGGVALALSRSEKLDALVTIGTFTRIRDMAPTLARALVPDEFRNADAARALDEPWYLIHGSRDDVVPVTHGKALFDLAAGKDGRAFVIRDADHRPAVRDLRSILAAIAASQAKQPLPPLSANVMTSSFAATK